MIETLAIALEALLLVGVIVAVTLLARIAHYLELFEVRQRDRMRRELDDARKRNLEHLENVRKRRA